MNYISEAVYYEAAPSNDSDPYDDSRYVRVGCTECRQVSVWFDTCADYVDSLGPDNYMIVLGHDLRQLAERCPHAKEFLDSLAAN